MACIVKKLARQNGETISETVGRAIVDFVSEGLAKPSKKLLSRRQLAAMLNVSVGQTYRLFGASKVGYGIMHEKHVLDYLAEKMVGDMPKPSVVPQLLTPLDVAVAYGVSVEDVLRMAHKKEPLPHYRLSRKCIRFDPDVTEYWMQITKH